MAKKKPEEKQTASEKLEDRCDKYSETVDAIIASYKEKIEDILDDYAMPQSLIDKLAAEYDGINTEIASANVNLSTDTADILIDAETDATEKYKLDFIENPWEFADDMNKFLKAIGDEELAYRLSQNGYKLIKVKSLADEIKLDEFLRTELYPFYRDQEDNIDSIF